MRWRRLLGIGGAALVAVCAAAVLALPASAQTVDWTVECDGDHILVQVDLAGYATTPDPTGNTVEVDDANDLAFIPKQNFGATFTDLSGEFPSSATDTFTMTIFAQDDPNGTNGGNGTQNQYDGTFTLTWGPCPENGSTSGRTAPTTTTTAPPTTTTTATAATTTTTTAATTTSDTAVVAAPTTTTTTTNSGGTLPFTGVSAGASILVAACLLAAGGAILLWLRRSARHQR